ncbi:hypothetical protein M1545_00415 [Patescibacteria group bacterium]|nr:hypothetical protein [Patescibacteria group bacterium]
METPEKAGLSFERESNPLAEKISPDRTCLLVSFPDERDEVKLPKPLVEAIIAGGVLVSALNDSDKKLGRRELLGGSLLFAALAGLGCNRGQPESTPTPDTPTPLPSPTATLKPDATPTRIPPTPTAVVINLPPVVGGPEPRPTPTPDIQRESLAQKAADYYLKNPLIDVLNNRPFSGVIVSERDTNGNLLISIRTLSGERLEDSVLAGNWGYFALDEKNEVTGIIWAKQETFKDSKGNVGYLGDSTIATKGAGWFGMEQMGYWTKDKKLIATVDPKTGEPVEKISETAPIIKGLVFKAEDKKYYAEKGNPYGLKEGVYAGEKITFNQGKDKGVVLTPEVVQILMKGQNTPEQIAKGEWQIPFPMDPRGKGVENLKIQEYQKVIYYFMIDGLPGETSFVSPLSNCTAYFYSKGIPHMTLMFPRDFDILAKDFNLGFLINQADIAIPSDGSKTIVDFGKRLFSKVSGRVKDTSSRYAQVFIDAASESENVSIALKNILTVENHRVFLLDKTRV